MKIAISCKEDTPAHPRTDYKKELQSPHLLSRDELAAHVRRYIETFHLNIITSAKIESTHYDPTTKRWEVKFATPSGRRTAIAKHLVQATGIASQNPYIPAIADSHLYKGISVHSAAYKNPKELVDKGVKVRHPLSNLPPLGAKKPP